MVLNPGKNQFMCMGKKIENAKLLNFNDLSKKEKKNKIKKKEKLNSKEVEILAIMLDRDMNFQIHIKNICRKAGQKLSRCLESVLPLIKQIRQFYYTSQCQNLSLVTVH